MFGSWSDWGKALLEGLTGIPGSGSHNITTDMNDYLGLSNTQQVQNALDALSGVGEDVASTSAANKALYSAWMQDMANTYGAGAGNYDDALANYISAVESAGEGFGGSVEDYLSPAIQQRVNAATNAITNSAANAGSMFSSDYLDSLAAKQQALASEEYENAYDRYMADRTATNAETQTNLSNLGNVVSLYGNDRNSLVDALTNYYTNVANQNNADLSATTDLATKQAELQSGENNGIGSALKLVGNIFSIL